MNKKYLLYLIASRVASHPSLIICEFVFQSADYDFAIAITLTLMN